MLTHSIISDLQNDKLEALKENVTYLEMLSRLQQWDKLMDHINWRWSDDLAYLQAWKNKPQLEQLSAFDDAIESYKSIVCAVDENHCNILYTILMWDYPVYAYLLLQMSGLEVNKTNNAGWTALMKASCFGQQIIAKILVRMPEVEVNTQCWMGCTALMIAANNGHKEIVELLLDCQSVTIDAKKDSGKDAIALAEGNEHMDIADMIRAEMQKRSRGTAARSTVLYAGSSMQPHLNVRSISWTCDNK